MSIWSILLWQPASPPDFGESLMATISSVWARNPSLCSLVLFNRVFTGRVPDTERYRFPYVSITSTGGTPGARTDKSQNSRVTITFHIWVDHDDLSRGEKIAEEVSAAYADSCWIYADGSKIIDVIDGGPPLINEVHTATIKTWHLIQTITVVVNRTRVATPPCCESSASFSEQSFPTDYDSSSLSQST